MLRWQDVDVQIEGVQVLRRVSFRLLPGATAALVGRNGAGKTTTLRTIMGFITPTGGKIWLGDDGLASVPPHERPRLGIGYAPEDRRLFTALSVEENLLLPMRVARRGEREIRARLDLIYDLLPELLELRARPGGSVSGGQGKMAALGRALMIGTRLVLLDEPFQGLAPALALNYAQALRRLRAEDRDLTLLITESNPALLQQFADVIYLIERGEVEPSTEREAPPGGP
jgi:branched-chain amino acid transport system ATP-binding protein